MYSKKFKYYILGGFIGAGSMKRILPVIILLVISLLPGRGQEGTYYYGPNGRPVARQAEAVTMKEVIKRSEGSCLMKTFRKAGDEWKTVSRGKVRITTGGDQVIRLRENSFFPQRIFREMEPLGSGDYLFSEYVRESLVRTGTTSAVLPLHLEGTVTEYHPGGNVKSISEYRDNQLVSNRNWLPDGSPYIDSVFYSADSEPEYERGDAFFNGYLLQKLQNSGIDLSQIEDRVVIGWVVMETGQIEGVIILKGIARQLNNYLVETIRELPGSWEPARLNGRPVRYFISIPLNFTHREANFQEVDLSTGRLHYSKY